MGYDALPRPPDPRQIASAVEGEPTLLAELIGNLADEHGAWNAGCLNLVASHNHLGPKARAVLSSSLADHILSGAAGKRSHAGGAWIEAIDAITVDLCKRTFGAGWVEFRPMSGAQANGVALMALTRTGDTVLAQPARYGGHHTYREDGYAGRLGLRVLDIPYDERAGEIDLDRLENLAQRERPKLILVGTASLRFALPVRELKGIAERAGAKLFYDGAHILGLVAGGQFQHPLNEGADIFTGSTQKTLGGPIGGLVLTADPDLGRSISQVTSKLISNYQNNRVAALAITLAEMRTFGGAYARQVVSNARTLARALDEAGVRVAGKERGYTDSHIVVFDTAEVRAREHAFARLEGARILTSRVELPSTHPERRGIRLGTSALTRVGMTETEITKVAGLIRRAVNEEPTDAIAAEVSELSQSYRTVRYCFH